MLHSTALQHTNGIGSITDIGSDTGNGISHDISIATNTSWT
jgi:hypothetical protein